MKYFKDWLVDRYGNVQSGASVTVKVNGSTATLYSDSSGTSASNPITTDSSGQIAFWYKTSGTYTFLDSKNSTLLTKTQSADFVPVTLFGAYGDGTTDDTAAVQNALNGLSGSGKTLYFPAGTYICGKLTLPDYVSLIGSGVDSIIKLKSSTNDHLLVSASWDSNASAVNIGNRLSNICLDGNKSGNSSGDCLVLRSYATVIDHCIFQNSATNGVQQTAVTKSGSNGASAAEVTYRRCRFKSNNGRGLYFYDNSTTHMSDAIVDKCLIHNNGTSGNYQVEAERSSGFHFTNNQIYAGYAGDVFMGKTGRTQVHHNHFDLAALGAASSGSYASLAIGNAGVDGGILVGTNFFFMGGTEVSGATYNCIDIQGAVPVSIKGNTFRNSGTYTTKRAIHRSALSACSGESDANYFTGFTESEFGQGWLDTAPAIVRVGSSAPANAASMGSPGMMAYDSGFIYICTAANTWKRVAVSTF